MRSLLSALILINAFLLPVSVFGQDSIDDLFNDPDAGIVEEEPEEAIDIDELTTQRDGPEFSGSAGAEAGIAVGMTSWDVPDTLEEAVSATPFYGMSSTLQLDARPSSQTRFFVSLGAEVPSGGSLVFDSFTINELFLDYTFLNTVFFRVGKQSAGWGQGQIFNPADLAQDVNGSTSIKASFPFLGMSGTLFAIARDGYFSDPDLPGIAEVGTAGELTGSISRVSFGIASFYQANSGLRSSAFLKSSLFGVDVAVEGVASWKQDLLQTDYDAVLSTLWEGTDIDLVVVADYLFESDRLQDGLGSSVGVGLAARDLLPDGWNPGIQWRHAFYDGSGEVVFGLDGTINEHLDLSIGMPIVYGADGTQYRDNATDSENRVLSLVVQLELSTSF